MEDKEFQEFLLQMNKVPYCYIYLNRFNNTQVASLAEKIKNLYNNMDYLKVTFNKEHDNNAELLKAIAENNRISTLLIDKAPQGIMKIFCDTMSNTISQIKSDESFKSETEQVVHIST